MYKIEITKKAQKQLAKFPKEFQVRIRSKIVILSINPLAGKPLEGKYKGSYSLRLWPYRIVYDIIKQKLLIQIIDITHRQGAYK